MLLEFRNSNHDVHVCRSAQGVDATPREITNPSAPMSRAEREASAMKRVLGLAWVYSWGNDGKGPPGRRNWAGSAGFDTSGTKRAFELADSTRLAPTVPLEGRKHARMGAYGSRCCAQRMRPPGNHGAISSVGVSARLRVPPGRQLPFVRAGGNVRTSRLDTGRELSPQVGDSPAVPMLFEPWPS